MIKRDELLAKRKDLSGKIAANEARMKEIEDSYKCNRCYEGFGCVQGMRPYTLILANIDLHKKANITDYNKSAEELGLKGIEEKDMKILGYTMDEWLNDFKLRAEYVKLEKTTEKLSSALEIIENNLSDDDKFAIEMQSVAELLDED